MHGSQLKRTKTPSKNYKYEQLQTVRKVALVSCTGSRFINGVSNQYDTKLPTILKGEVDEAKYTQHMNHINKKLQMYWPCTFAHCCGYLFAPVTLGLSLLIPRVCVSEAEAILRK